MLTHENMDRQVGSAIERYIAARGATRKHVYLSAGLSRQTFEKAIKGGTSFKLSELVKIADALGVTPYQLLPEAWSTTDEVAS